MYALAMEEYQAESDSMDRAFRSIDRSAVWRPWQPEPEGGLCQRAESYMDLANEYDAVGLHGLALLAGIYSS
jgi:hypothetical protein